MMYEEDAQNNGVFRFLQQLGLEKHWDIFKAKGYDRETDLLELSPADMEYMHITGQESTNILHAGEYINFYFLFVCFTPLQQYFSYTLAVI